MAKWVYFENRELQFGTGKLKSIIGNFEGTKGSFCFIRI